MYDTLTYDEKGMPFIMEYREGDSTALYYYLTDAFGKITGLMDESGTIVCRYAYDGYGNAEAKMTWLGGLGSTPNPFRYNGYYYDSETGLYYCNSRYYDAENCRFINADEYVSTGQGMLGYNMYAYCGNEPISRKDPLGMYTVGLSVSCSAFFIVGISYSFSFVMDDKGNIGFQISKANLLTKQGGVGFGTPSVGASVALSGTTYDTINDLNGPALNVGGTAEGVGVELACDVNDNIKGATISKGVGSSLPEAHITCSTTKPYAQTTGSEFYEERIAKPINTYVVQPIKNVASETVGKVKQKISGVYSWFRDKFS